MGKSPLSKRLHRLLIRAKTYQSTLNIAQNGSFIKATPWKSMLFKIPHRDMLCYA